MKRITLIPAYGRDYKSKKALLVDFHDDKDFLVQDVSAGRDNGRYANLKDLRQAGIEEANIRYKQLTMVAVVPVK
jgi:hypothetical protein